MRKIGGRVMRKICRNWFMRKVGVRGKYERLEWSGP